MAMVRIYRLIFRYLWLKGVPQIEYLQTRVNKTFKYTSESLFDYGWKSFLDNIYITFGTRNILKVLLPSMRLLPLNGLEWTASRINFQRSLKSVPINKREDRDDLEIRNLEID